MTAADDLARRLETLSPKQRRLLELRLARERQETPPAKPAGEEPIPVQPRDGRTFPLSFAQQRLWFLDQLEPGSPWYNMAFPLRLAGRLDLPALAATLSEIRRRHEALRTTFSLSGEGEETAVQVVGPPSGLPLPLVDLSGLPEAAREAELLRRVRAEARRPFDLARGPLLRARLFATAPDEHALLLSMHHVVCDGWSLGVLVRELGQLYDAFSRRAPSPLAPLPLQYADFAVWQRQHLSGPVLDGLLSWWKRQLAGLPPLLELPTDRPRPRVQTFRGTTLPVALPPGATAAVRELSRRAGATTFMTLLAAFLALLRRHTRQDDLAVGSPVANRERMEIEGLVGFFVNTLVLRADTGGDPSFRDLLARVRTAAAGAYAHQDLPFETLVQEIDPERQLSHNPLFQVMFLLQNAPMPELSVSGLKLAPLPVGGGTAKFDLSLHFWEAEPELVGYFEYNTDLFDRATVARLADHLARLLQGALADPDRRLSALPLLAPAERRQVLGEWNDSAAVYPRDACLHDLFAARAERAPDAVAVTDWQGRESLTYAQLAGRAGHLARRLRDLGVGPDVPVAICLRRSPALPVAVLGALGAGGAYVPVDPSYPRERLERMLEIARPRVLLTEEALKDAIPAGDFEVICLDGDEGSDSFPRVAVHPDNLLYVIFTSGSTGVPKGVAMPHRPLVSLVDWQLRNTALGPGARTLQFASLSFDVSCQELFSTWAAGGTLVLITEELRLDSAALLDVLRSQSVERLFLPFVALQQLAEIAAERAVDGASKETAWPEALREVVTAGEQLQITPAVAELFTRLPRCRLYNQYGPSETHVATAHALSGPARHWPALPSIGAPVANTRVHLLDPALGTLVPAGVAGELCIAGDCLARGYLARPDLTAERFVPDPFGEGERLYRTGDLARWRDGNLEFLGRIDQQLKIRGFRVEPGEIEAVLAAHPAVREAAVVARQDPGTSARRLVAYVAAQGPVTAGELRSAVRGRLPDYMVPSAFHVLDTLPLTPSGKIDRRSLPDLETPAGEEAGSVPPRTPLEEEIAAIWRQVMGIERVGVHDSFFDLGGHSLLAVRLLARIRRQLGRDLPLASLFAGPTIAHQAAALERESLPDTPLVALRSTGTQRPLFLVHPVGGSVFCYAELTRALGPDQPVYGLQASETAGTLEDMAAAYLEALRTVQPEGPYRLGGWSLGGVVAFEMARQLGGQVEQLAVLDVPAPRGEGAVDEGTVRAWFARDLAGLQSRPLPAELGTLSAGTPLPEAFARAQELGLLPEGLDFAAAARRLEIFRSNLQRLGSYAAQPYAGRLQLFRAEASHFDDPADPTLGWGALAAGGVELRRLPGDHWAIVAPPAVEAVAEALRPG